MVRKLALKFPLHKCECGGVAALHPYNTFGGKCCGYFVSCCRFACNRMATKIYKNPLIAVIKWNLKDWKYSKENNRYLKGEK